VTNNFYWQNDKEAGDPTFEACPEEEEEELDEELQVTEINILTSLLLFRGSSKYGKNFFE
jgi:hypothetical protein